MISQLISKIKIFERSAIYENRHHHNGRPPPVQNRTVAGNERHYRTRDGKPAKRRMVKERTGAQNAEHISRHFTEPAHQRDIAVPQNWGYNVLQ